MVDLDRSRELEARLRRLVVMLEPIQGAMRILSMHDAAKTVHYALDELEAIEADLHQMTADALRDSVRQAEEGAAATLLTALAVSDELRRKVDETGQ